VNLSLTSRIVLRAITVLGMLFLYVPLAVVVVLSFNKATSLSWPPTGLTLDWWSRARVAEAPREALWTSVKTALAATLVALVLGTLAAFSVHKYKFFGRTTVSFLLILPIALPGIVTAVALQATFGRVGFDLGFRTVVIAHATFCVVLAYNNVIARLRRMPSSVFEASADLGATGFQTFRYVTLPLVRSALLAGALLAFALSFDEIVVTTFTSGAGFETLPQWIFNNFSRPNSVPLVNVVATVVMVMSIPLAWLAQRLSDGTDALGRA
jgi:putative spermidine/putrescine transport system permease protein